MSYAVEAENLHKSYGSLKVLSGVSLKVKAGVLPHPGPPGVW